MSTPASRIKSVLAAGLVFAGAFTLGRITTASAPTKTERVIERGPERTIIHRSGGTGISVDDVRAVVREELARDPDATQPVRHAEPPADPDRFARAQAALDEGLADGRWTEADRERLAPTLDSLTREEVEHIFSKLFPALNSGQLTVEIVGPAV